MRMRARTRSRLPAVRMESCKPFRLGRVLHDRKRGAAYSRCSGSPAGRSVRAPGTSSDSSSSRFGFSSPVAIVMPGQVAARTREACDKAGFDRIDTDFENDRDRRGRLFCRARRASRRRLPRSRRRPTRRVRRPRPGSRSKRPSAQRYYDRHVLPSVPSRSPSARDRKRQLAAQSLSSDTELPRNPMTGMAFCCARASGHAIRRADQSRRTRGDEPGRRLTSRAGYSGKRAAGA